MSRGISLDPDALDYSMFSQSDLVNIVLQRSDVIRDVPGWNRMIKAWEGGDPEPLNGIVAKNGLTYARRAARLIRQEFDDLRAGLVGWHPPAIADIGCGYALFDLFAFHGYGSDLLLIDIEDNEHSHFGFREEGAAYSDLSVARAFLSANGVPDDKIRTWNPETQDLDADAPVELAVSLLSCGFHYPVDMYMPFFRFGVSRRGGIVLDLRNGQFTQIRKRLEPLGRMTVLSQNSQLRRVLITRKGRT